MSEGLSIVIRLIREINYVPEIKESDVGKLLMKSRTKYGALSVVSPKCLVSVVYCVINDSLLLL